jgi:probable F420-dependent oxidoreductase
MRVERFVLHGTWQSLADTAVAAEEAGFDAFACPEVAHDPFIPLAFAATRTARIGLRTAIAVAFARSPMITANLAWDLHAASRGRFCLGLGTQVQAHVERRFSATWTKPRSQLREYVLAVRAIHRAWEKQEKLRFAGNHYGFSLMTPEFSPAPTGLAPVPIYTAAVRPAMIELAGEVADGVRLHGFMTRRYLEQVGMPALDKGLAVRGRARAGFEVCGGGFVATGPDEETVARMRELIRYRVAFYASTQAYFPVLEAHGWVPLGEKLRKMSLTGKWNEMAAQIDDEVLDAFCVAGTFRDLAPRVAARFEGLTDCIELGLPEGTPEGAARELLTDLHAIPTRCAAVAPSWDDISATYKAPVEAAAAPTTT